MNDSPDYELLQRQLTALVDAESDPVAQLANVSAVLFDSIPDINWIGFYRVDEDELCLGPFQGKVACTRIPWGQGVCGVAAASAATLRVANVHEFDGHIACDSASNSELVVPIISDGRVVAVLDADSPSKDRFSQTDQYGLEAIAPLLVPACSQLALLPAI